MRRKDTGIVTTVGTSIVKSSMTSNTLTYPTYTTRAERRYMVGANTPGFHRLKREGKLIPHTPFTQVEWTGKCLPGYFKATRNSDGNHTFISNWGGGGFSAAYTIDEHVDKDVDPTTSPPAAEMDYAHYHLQRAAAKITQRGWDALTFSAEAGKTARMFNGFTRRLMKLLKTRDPRHAHKLWLEGRYGWRTLAYDVRDIHDAAMNWDAKRKLFTERSGLGASLSSPSEHISTFTWGTSTHRLYRSYSHEFSIRGSVAGLFSPARLRVNPVNTAWELVPFSFVIDWVYDVGTALDAAAFLMGSRAYTASVGYQCVSTVEYEHDWEQRPGYTVICDPVRYVYEGTRVSRSPASISTTPQLTGRAATPDLALDLTALARLRSRL